MLYTRLFLEDEGVSVEASAFALPQGVKEWHALLHVEPRNQGFEAQLSRLYAAEDSLPSLPFFEGACYILKRYFLTDCANQQPLMREDRSGACVSSIGQPPLDGSKVAVWVYMASGMEVTTKAGLTVAEHNGYRHLWRMGMCHPEGNASRQTEALLENYAASLRPFAATLAGNCVRTWFFVRDVDTQYAGMVAARREYFKAHGLTPDTHFIASTGIGGIPADTSALVQMGAYAITGLTPRQVSYINAPTHLNPTYEYGVTFERATRIDYGDRRHVIISGTASIDNRGEVLHSGDIERQTQRMWDNVEALLREGETGFEDVAQIVVYLRDVADYDTVSSMFRTRFPDIPTVLTLAPVCRPSWLVEMECLAIKKQEEPSLRAF